MPHEQRVLDALDAITDYRDIWADVASLHIRYDASTQETLRASRRSARLAASQVDSVVYSHRMAISHFDYPRLHEKIRVLGSGHPLWDNEAVLVGPYLPNQARLNELLESARRNLKKGRQVLSDPPPFIDDHPITAQLKRVKIPGVSYMRNDPVRKASKAVTLLDATLALLANCELDVAPAAFRTSLVLAIGCGGERR